MPRRLRQVLRMRLGFERRPRVRRHRGESLRGRVPRQAHGGGQGELCRRGGAVRLRARAPGRHDVPLDGGVVPRRGRPALRRDAGARRPAPPRASFDCNTARTPLEKAICADAKLGRADLRAVARLQAGDADADARRATRAQRRRAPMDGASRRRLPSGRRGERKGARLRAGRVRRRASPRSTNAPAARHDEVPGGASRTEHPSPGRERASSQASPPPRGG